MIIKEVKIPVPWGFIAAKTWGNEKHQIVLVVHGWLDNASSFDTLIPILPQSYYYVCIDLPSHGFSSHLKSSLFIHHLDYMVVIKIILDVLNRGKYIILGHSFGNFISTMFTQLYPDYVLKLISLDAYHFFSIGPINYVSILKERADILIKLSMKKTHKIPTYTLEEARHRMRAGRMTSISKEAVDVLLRRSVVPAENGKFKFTISQNVKYMIRPAFTDRFILEMVKLRPIKCPHLLIISTNTMATTLSNKDLHKEYVKNKKFEFHIVKGTHEVHLENPERVAPIISKFLLKNTSKL